MSEIKMCEDCGLFEADLTVNTGLCEDCEDRWRETHCVLCCEEKDMNNGSDYCEDCNDEKLN